MHNVKSARLALTLVALLALASPLSAQEHGRRDDNGRTNVPPGQRPPAGMCRVWIDGVPPGRQPAPTDCSTALATRPSNGHVIYGSRSNSFPGRGNGKWKNTQQSSGNIYSYPYGSTRSRDARTARGDRDDDDRNASRSRHDEDRYTGQNDKYRDHEKHKQKKEKHDHDHG